LAQRGNAIDTLVAQMNEAEQGGRNAEGLALAQKLEALVRRRQRHQQHELCRRAA
jgi:hypothetical protein